MEIQTLINNSRIKEEIKTNCRLLEINTNKSISCKNIRTLCSVYLIRTMELLSNWNQWVSLETSTQNRVQKWKCSKSWTWTILTPLGLQRNSRTKFALSKEADQKTFELGDTQKSWWRRWSPLWRQIRPLPVEQWSPNKTRKINYNI